MSGLVGHRGLLLAPAGGGGDPYWANVVSLMHFDGASGSTTFTDEKGRSWSRNGSTTVISTAQSKFGGSSLYVGNTRGAGTSNGLYTASSSDFDYGTGDFTIEWWQYLTDTTNNQCLLSRGGFATAGSMLIQKDPSEVVAYIGPSKVLSESMPTVNVWQHNAFCRESGTVRKYRNGVQTYTTSGAGSVSHTAALGIGAYANGTYATCGYLDDMRITKGVCRYPGGTTFAVPTAPFPNF